MRDASPSDRETFLFLPPIICSALASDSVQADKRRKKLSRREMEAPKAIALGHTTKEIAGDLEVREKTVQTYRERIQAFPILTTRARSGR